MKKLIILLFIPLSIISQEIKWNTVPIKAINPSELVSSGIIELDNGDKTPQADLYINFGQKKIFYRNQKSNSIFSIFKEDFSKISVSDYKDGEMVRDKEFYGDVGQEIGASLRKNLYNKADLNIMNITSVQKEGFFNRKQPKFFINPDGELDVSNKAIVVCKILSLTPLGFGYLDSEGDLWLRGNSRAKNISAGEGEDKAAKREEKKEARKQARILNINFANKSFLNTRELYDYFYEEYEKNFYESLEQFREDFKGRNLREFLSSWGPHTEQFQLDSDTKLFVWSFERKITESESITVGASTILSKITQTSETNTNASITAQYGINTKTSKYNLGGYGSVMNSYSKIRGSSFLNYYSKNVIRQYASQQATYVGRSTSTEILVDDTKKIGLIVNNDLIIQEVVAKNFFPEPYYGVAINFFDR
tara:strand:+ start:197 stop:1459 length:1263 start_codon:yes stop_codon:yes gene_type:complete